MIVIETERLALRELEPADAPFIFELVNDPDWLTFIGDRGVHSLDDALAYIEKGPRAMYAQRGHGLWLVERKADGAAMGMCGLLKRDTLDDVDIGYAMLPAFRGQGYIAEAVAATLAHGHGALGLRRIVAITVPENVASARVLTRAGMRLERTLEAPPGGRELNLYAVEG
ncbi:MAG: GNAT family N-acetyltransferase [Gemmatimonadetes bacterium]|nr:GNAT family N-acetyltransferase [Gemmatimonadota bacterium]